MMRAIIVYESIWGNTERLARAIAGAVQEEMAVDIFDSDAAPHSLDGYDLIIVGGPTHAFSMSRPATRETALKQNGASRVPSRGIREWIAALRSASSMAPVVTFDTRADSPRLPGSAAKAARHELRSLGFAADAKPMSFHVHGYEGPLVEGELDRAADWARELATALAAAPA
jgi:hypothetical protein